MCTVLLSDPAKILYFLDSFHLIPDFPLCILGSQPRLKVSQSFPPWVLELLEREKYLSME